MSCEIRRNMDFVTSRRLGDGISSSPLRHALPRAFHMPMINPALKPAFPVRHRSDAIERALWHASCIWVMRGSRMGPAYVEDHDSKRRKPNEHDAGRTRRGPLGCGVEAGLG